MENSIIQSKVILCPLNGDIRIDWHKNVALNESMLKWHFFEPTSTGGKAERIKREKPYQTCLNALLELSGFNFYVGLEVNTQEEYFIFWNNKFQIDVYLKEVKILNLPMTGFAKHPLGIWGHFDCIPEQLEVQGWNKDDWKKYFYDQLYEKSLSLLNESNNYSKRAITSNKKAEEIFQNLCSK